RADTTAELIMRLILMKPSRAEHGNAWADKVQGAEALDELDKDLDRLNQFRATRLRPFQKTNLRRRRRRLAPVRLRLRRLGRQLRRSLFSLRYGIQATTPSRESRAESRE